MKRFKSLKDLVDQLTEILDKLGDCSVLIEQEGVKSFVSGVSVEEGSVVIWHEGEA